MFNYHTHTYRCRHASGEVRDYAAQAVKAGLNTLGLSDHAPLPGGRWPRVRMTMDETQGYFHAIDEARELYPELTIYRAFECEYVPELDNYYRELKEKWSLDYLIGAVHWIPHRGEWISMHSASPALLSSYVKNLTQAMASGHFLFMAHPDNFAAWPVDWNEKTKACCREIFSAARQLDIPLEINGYGFRKPKIRHNGELRPPYPWRPYWEMAGEYGVSVLFNSDAHRPEDVYASAEEGRKFISALGLKAVDPMKNREIRDKEKACG